MTGKVSKVQLTITACVNQRLLADMKKAEDKKHVKVLYCPLRRQNTDKVKSYVSNDAILSKDFRDDSDVIVAKQAIENKELRYPATFSCNKSSSHLRLQYCRA